MDIQAWTIRASELVSSAGLQDKTLTVENFLDYAETIKDIVLELPKKVQQSEAIVDFAHTTRRLRDDFEDLITADPMCVYKPKHQVALAFHKSRARIRYYFGANRTSKTVSGIAEVYWTVTDQHPFRPSPPQPAQVAVIGTNYSQYAPTVFEPKYISGEQGNPLSPAFPEGGKWLHRYDPRKHILEVACKHCAEAGEARDCPHPKRKIILFSDEGKDQAIAGGQYAGIHYDEQVKREFFVEGRERVKTVPNSWIAVTETPVRGRGFWTQAELVPLADSGATVGDTGDPICETFQIDQFQAGLIKHDEILASMVGRPESEIRVRVFGEPLISLEKAVFDVDVLAHMRETDSRIGAKGSLLIEVPQEEGKAPVPHDQQDKYTQKDLLTRAGPNTRCQFREDPMGDLEIWEVPKARSQYVIGADVAHGLTKRDASCADVLKMVPTSDTIALEQAAQYHAWINPMLYAEELFKLGLYYSHVEEEGDIMPYFPWLIVERNGPGMEVIQCLMDMGCWFVFQDVTSVASPKYTAQTQLGIATTWASKPILISILQNIIRARKFGQPSVVIRSGRTIDQCEAYIQEETEKGNVSFRGEGTRDDCVMSLAVGTYGVRNFPLYDYNLQALWRERERMESGGAAEKRAAEMWEEVRSEREQRQEQLEEMEYDDLGFGEF